jgi:hypothetical protein
MEGGECAGCKALRESLPLLKVMKRAAFHKHREKRRWSTSINNRIVMKNLRDELRRARRTIIVSKLVKPQTHAELISKSSLKKDLKAVGMRLAFLARQGEIDEIKNQTSLDITTNVIQNVVREPHGKRYSQRTRAFVACLRTFGASQAHYNMVSDNLNLSGGVGY